MQAFLTEDLLEEEVGQDTLAHEPALQIGEHAEHGVDLTGVGERLELFRVEHAYLFHRASSPPIRTRRPWPAAVSSTSTALFV